MNQPFLSALAVILPFALLSPLAAATFPQPFNTEKTPGAPQAAGSVADQLVLPPGFRCTVFAAEPDVAQPIAMATDARGRLWVAENYTYSERTSGFADTLRDRIVIFEDTDNDGRFDRRTVFWDGAQRLTSIEVGLGGVWALSLPNLVFIPDRNGDDVPDAAPEILLEGFEHVRARHNVANGLRWGPDGWLYGRQGILGYSPIRRPESPAGEHTLLNAGIWRFHPIRRDFEIVAEGTTNPWGMDWDAHGEGFFINTVIGHLWHLIPGAHYRRMAGDDRNPYVYELIDQHADHVHWATGEVWTDVRKGVSDQTLARGGGHAHTGLLIYQGGQWPQEWNGRLLTINFHGRRLNVERLERRGSGFVGRGEPDQFMFPDPWFRGLDLLAAPDGSVFVSDWSDAGECHDNDGIHRSSGRIYKLSYGDARPRDHGDLARLDGPALAALQQSENDWLARQSRRVLADRAAASSDIRGAHAALQRLMGEANPPLHRLRALWALHVSGGMTAAKLITLLDDRDEFIRAWAVRLILEAPPASLPENALAAFVRTARAESSALVRLAFASALQRLAPAQRVPLAAALLAHEKDAEDHNLPLILWYGIEPLADAAGDSFVKLIAAARLPLVQRLGARRLAEEIDLTPERLDRLLLALDSVASPAGRLAILEGIGQGLSGRRQAPKPASWDRVQAAVARGADQAILARLRDLSALFGDGRALDEIRAVALDGKRDLPQRRAALQVLIESRAPGLRELCERLLPVRELSPTAAAGLALFDDPAIADVLLAEWPRLVGIERPPVMNVLVSRPAWAAKTLDALAAGKLLRGNITAFHARQIRSLHVPALTAQLDRVWGRTADDSEPERQAAMVGWQKKLTPETLAHADRANGRRVFASLCASCHTLNGEGQTIGPDLTGAARDNLGYLLENILFPSAIVPDEYRLSNVTLKDGRVLAGMIRTRTPRLLKLQTMSGPPVSLATGEIEKVDTASLSLMPPGLINGLEEAQARDLIAYLVTK